MKDKMIKNIGIMLGTSNFAFASGTSAKRDKDELLKKAQETFKKFSKDNDEKKVKEFVDKLYSPSSIYIKEKSEKDKTNKYTLNNNVSQNSIEVFFKGSFLNFDKKYKKILFIFKENLDISFIEDEDNNGEKIKSEYLKLLGTKGSNPTFIAVEITPKDGKVGTINLVKCTNSNEEKALRDKYQPEKPYDTKELFEKIISTLKVTTGQTDEEKNKEKEKALAIIKLLQSYKLGFGEHTLNDNELQKVVTALDKGLGIKSNHIRCVFREIQNNFEYSATPEVNKFEKGVDYNQMKTYINNSALKESDLVISILKNKKLLLIAKGSDIVAGKIKNNEINSKFYKEVAKDINGINNKNFQIFTEHNSGIPKEKRSKSSRRSVEQDDVKNALTNSIITNYNNTEECTFSKFKLATSISGVELIECSSVYELNFKDGIIEVGNEVVCNGNNKNLKLSKDKMYLVIFKQDDNEEKTTIPAAIVKNCELQINDASSDLEEYKK